MPALSDGLRDLHFASCRPAYALALLKIDRPAAKAAVPALIEILDCKNHAVYLPDESASTIRKQAASALGRIGGEDREAIPALAGTWRTGTPVFVRKLPRLSAALGVQARPAVPSLQKALHGPRGRRAVGGCAGLTEDRRVRANQRGTGSPLAAESFPYHARAVCGWL